MYYITISGKLVERFNKAPAQMGRKSIQHGVSVVHTASLQLHLTLPLLLVILHFVDHTPRPELVELGGVGKVNILIIETLHVVIIGVLLVRVVSSP